MDECRFILAREHFWNSYFSIHFDKTVLLKKEQKNATNFIGDIRSPVSLIITPISGIYEIRIRKGCCDKNLPFFGSPFFVILQLGNRFGLNDLPDVLAAESICVSRGTLHENVSKLVKHDNSYFIGF